jgi:hypothetical protein
MMIQSELITRFKQAGDQYEVIIHDAKKQKLQNKWQEKWKKKNKNQIFWKFFLRKKWKCKI